MADNPGAMSPQDQAHAFNQRIVLFTVSAVAVIGVVGAFACILTHTPIPDAVWGSLVAGPVGVLSGMLINTRPGAGSTVVVGSAQPNGDESGQIVTEPDDPTIATAGAPELLTTSQPAKTRRRPSPTVRG